VEIIPNLTDIYRLVSKMEQAVSTSFDRKWSQGHLTLEPVFSMDFTETLLTLI